MPHSLEITLLLIGGLVLLLLGGELLLRGGVRLARALGMPPVLVALTVLAFGSLPTQTSGGAANRKREGLAEAPCRCGFAEGMESL